MSITTITIGLPDSVTITDAFTVNGNTTLGSDEDDVVTFNASKYPHNSQRTRNGRNHSI